MKILCLGNEFIKHDSLAKKIGIELEEEGYNITNIEDSFQLIEELNSSNDFIILDVVEDITNIKLLKINDLKDNKIITCHDFDAQFILKLFENKKITIIGIPANGKEFLIKKNIKNILNNFPEK